MLITHFYVFQSKKSIGSRQRCGNSEFQGSKEVSTRYNTLSESGILMASCGHGVIQWSVNMYEIFGEVNMLSEEILRLKAVYDEALTYLRYFCETPIFSES